jgi:hypothetical protein
VPGNALSGDVQEVPVPKVAKATICLRVSAAICVRNVLAHLEHGRRVVPTLVQVLVDEPRFVVRDKLSKLRGVRLG